MKTKHNNAIEESIKISLNDLIDLLYFYNRIRQTYDYQIFIEMGEDMLEELKDEYQLQLKAGKIISRILKAYMDHESIWENQKWEEDSYFTLIERKIGLDLTMEVAEEGLEKLKEFE